MIAIQLVNRVPRIAVRKARHVGEHMLKCDGLLRCTGLHRCACTLDKDPWVFPAGYNPMNGIVKLKQASLVKLHEGNRGDGFAHRVNAEN